MRIALVALHFAEYASRLALALAQDHTVLLVLRTDNAKSELSNVLREALEKNVKLVLIEHRQLRQPGIISATRSLIGAVTRFNPDVVHCQEYLADYAAWGALWLSSKFPLVLTVHDHQSHSGADSALPLRKQWYRRQLRNRADRIIVHGETIRHEMLADPAQRQKSIVSIMHGVLGVDECIDCETIPEPRTLLFFGRIEAYKGLRVLLDALDILKSRNSEPVRLIIAGRGSDLETQRARVEANPAIELIDQFIPVEAIPGLFSRSAIVVLPYIDATQSGVAALAFAFGRPVIASATGALPEVVREGETGALVPPGDATSLAAAIEHVQTTEHLWQKLSEGALRYAKSDLSWAEIAIQTASSYAVLLRRVDPSTSGMTK